MSTNSLVRASEVTPMGFTVSAQNETWFSDSISDLVENILQPFKDAKIIHFDAPQNVKIKVGGDEKDGKKFIVSCPNKHVAQAIRSALLILDDKARMSYA